MERVLTNMDQHGRVLIPVSIRERFNMHPGEKITIEIDNNGVKIINTDNIIDEMHEIFMKNQHNKNKKISTVDDFIANKRQEYLIEEARSKK
ncbi:MAG TPA: AbrB/MazE/SpoVT family DNA-binding domain-containing protein [Rickettsia endosymbiont of Pyrocoelia pectoralis]|nr:AbrB/MazE/SpoVT family DNA-binding domain-containing protein [Rickettsia endosymbiont of Pyrocoelia pectoralis]